MFERSVFRMLVSHKGSVILTTLVSIMAIQNIAHACLAILLQLFNILSLFVLYCYCTSSSQSCLTSSELLDNCQQQTTGLSGVQYYALSSPNMCAQGIRAIVMAGSAVRPVT